jgi:hypothetical protein
MEGDMDEDQPGAWEKFKSYASQLIRKPAEEGEEKEAKHRTKGTVRIKYKQGKWRGSDDDREYVYHPGTNTVDEIGYAD